MHEKQLSIKIGDPVPRLSAEQIAQDWSDTGAFERQSAIYPNNRSHGVQILELEPQVLLVDPAPGMPVRKQTDGTFVRQESPADLCVVWVRIRCAAKTEELVENWASRVVAANKSEDKTIRGRT